MSDRTFVHARGPAVALVAVIAAGCGGGGTTPVAGGGSPSPTAPSETVSVSPTASPTPTAGRTACTVVTAIDIFSALKVTVGEAAPFTEGTVSGCSYATADGSTTVRVKFYDPAGDLIARTKAANPPGQVVPGVREEAVEQLSIGTVTVRSGRFGVSIAVVPHPSTVVLTQLARQASGHLS